MAFMRQLIVSKNKRERVTYHSMLLIEDMSHPHTHLMFSSTESIFLAL